MVLVQFKTAFAATFYVDMESKEVPNEGEYMTGRGVTPFLLRNRPPLTSEQLAQVLKDRHKDYPVLKVTRGLPNVSRYVIGIELGDPE